MRFKFTKTTVEAAPPGEHFDDAIAGFCLRVRPNGDRVYFLKYQVGHGRKGRRIRWYRIGRHGELTTAQARTMAEKARAQVVQGIDPKAADDARKTSGTVVSLTARYLEEYAEPHKKPRSVKEDRRNLDKYVIPAIGRLAVGAVTRKDILDLQFKMKGTPTLANRVVALISKMFTLAEVWELRPAHSNPASMIKKYREISRERFLSADELLPLGAAIETAIRVDLKHLPELRVIKTLLLTGARLSEITHLRWAWIDLDRGVARLPDSKPNEAKTIQLPPPILEMLVELPRTCEIVFPDARGRPLYTSKVERAWWRIRTSLGLEDVRLHDLRHNFASWAAMGGLSLPMIGQLLGHRHATTTARYAHFAANPVAAAAASISGAITAMMAGETPRRGAE